MAVEPKLTRFRARQLREEFRAGVKIEVLKQRYRVSEKTIKIIVEGKPYVHLEEHMAQEKYPAKKSSTAARKLTMDDAREIRSKLKKGWNMKALANKYNVSIRTIQSIRDGDRYKEEK